MPNILLNNIANENMDANDLILLGLDWVITDCLPAKINEITYEFVLFSTVMNRGSTEILGIIITLEFNNLENRCIIWNCIKGSMLSNHIITYK